MRGHGQLKEIADVGVACLLAVATKWPSSSPLSHACRRMNMQTYVRVSAQNVLMYKSNSAFDYIRHVATRVKSQYIFR